MPRPKKQLKDILSEKPVWDIDEIFRLFTKKLKEKGLYDQKYSKGKGKFFVKELYESYGVEQSKELVEYYFKVYDSPNWDHFIRNSDSFYKAMQLKKEDDRIRELMRQQAKDWLNR